MNSFLGVFFNTFVNVMEALLIVYVVMPFFVPPSNRFRAFVDSVVNAFLNPIRSVIPQTGPFDLAFLVLWGLLIFLQAVASSL